MTPSRRAHSQPHKELRVGVDGHTENVLWRSAGIGNRRPAHRCQICAALRTEGDTADSIRVGKAYHEVSIDYLPWWKLRGATQRRV